tara:strand:- start:433 stop:600 length:168 start_codon:yes stop_codon:yes gene_type:complete
MHYLNDFDSTSPAVDLALDNLHRMALDAQEKDASLSEIRQSGGYLTAALELAYAE